jgi:hypothetical protein
MGFFKNLKLKNRFATRLGAALRARDKGVTIEQAWQHTNELYPPTQEQMGDQPVRVWPVHARKQRTTEGGRRRYVPGDDGNPQLTTIWCV